MQKLLTAICLLAAAAAGQQDSDPKFRALDEDGDGKLTADELKNPQLFKRLDVDRDGVVTLQEARALNRRPTPREIAYGKDPAQRLDLYALKGKPKRPVMVMIHGGGWRQGDKRNSGMTRSKVPFFLGRGYVYVSINYRLSGMRPGDPGVRHPVHAQDCAKALAWVHDNVAKYGGDPERIHIMGHSAGGHLAALLSTNERFLKAEGKAPRIFRSCVLLDPAGYDVAYVLERARNRKIRDLYENAFGKDKKRWPDASPIKHVGANKQIPPMLIFYTGKRMDADKLAPAFAQALTKAGSPSRAVDTVTLTHGQINTRIGTDGDAMTALILRLHAGEKASAFPARLWSLRAGRK